MEKGNKTYHFLDRFIGIPAVFLLGLIKSRFRKRPLTLRKIAIVNLFSIGDNVLMSGVIRDLVADYPEAELVAFVANNNYQIVKLIPGFARIHKLPISNFLKTVFLIRQEKRFDLVIDFGSWPRVSALYSAFIKANYKIGFNSRGQFRHYIFDQTIDYSHHIHEIENYRNLINSFRRTNIHHLPMIGYIKSKKSDDLILEFKKYCIIHPWPGGYKSILKQWNNKRWTELIYIISQYFDTIVLTGAPSDNEKSIDFRNEIDHSRMKCKFREISGVLSLGETAHLIKQASFVISIDTGIAHMSAAFDKPLICIQGPANSIRWRPYSQNSISIVPDKGTFGYLSFGFEYYRAKENCMENISVVNVYQVFKNLLAKQ